MLYVWYNSLANQRLREASWQSTREEQANSDQLLSYTVAPAIAYYKDSKWLV